MQPPLPGKEPEKMELSYETNPGTNYIASKMSETAMEENPEFCPGRSYPHLCRSGF